jgi:hypothetical protein
VKFSHTNTLFLSSHTPSAMTTPRRKSIDVKLKVAAFHLRLALMNMAPPHAVSAILEKNPSCARFRFHENGWTPLHYACRHYSSLGVISLVLRAYPDAIGIVDKNGRAPFDCLPSSLSPKEIDAVKQISFQDDVVSISNGIGGARRAREKPWVEQLQFVKHVKIYTVPLGGFVGFIGGLHSIVELHHERNASHKVEAVWIERVGVATDTGSNVVVTDPTKRSDLKLIAEAHSRDLKDGLSMFEVHEFVV